METIIQIPNQALDVVRVENTWIWVTYRLDILSNAMSSQNTYQQAQEIKRDILFPLFRESYMCD